MHASHLCEWQLNCRSVYSNTFYTLPLPPLSSLSLPPSTLFPLSSLSLSPLLSLSSPSSLFPLPPLSSLSLSPLLSLSLSLSAETRALGFTRARRRRVHGDGGVPERSKSKKGERERGERTYGAGTTAWTTAAHGGEDRRGEILTA
jgi:hypothetical protein